ELVAKGVQRLDPIHLLPNHVRGIVIEAEIILRDIGEHPFPNRGGGGKILSTWPFVGSEEHRAIFNANAHAMILCETNERLPNLQKARPVIVNAFAPIAADKSVYAAKIQFLGGDNHFLKVLNRLVRDF